MVSFTTKNIITENVKIFAQQNCRDLAKCSVNHDFKVKKIQLVQTKVNHTVTCYNAVSGKLPHTLVGLVILLHE